MKKVILTIAVALIGAGAFAQDFEPAWFAGLKGGAAYTAGETAFTNLISPNAAVYVGRQFSPVFGLRLEAGGWQAKGCLVGRDAYKYNFVNADIDALFDICNMFGYKERVLNPYIFAGIGGAYRFNNGEAQAQKAYFPANNYLWDGGKIGLTGRVGLGLDIKLSKAVAITLEVADNIHTDHFNSKVGETTVGPDFDYHIAALAGLKFTFGGKKKAAPVAEPAPAPAPVEAAPVAEPVKAVEPAPAPEVVEEDTSDRACVENIYFIINKSELRPCEQFKIDHLVSVLNKYPDAVVTLSGYADKETGNYNINQRLSKERAAIVKKALIAAGIDESRISSAYFGDTQKVSQVPEENRVCVCVTE